jgi:hypothetical protein
LLAREGDDVVDPVAPLAPQDLVRNGESPESVLGIAAAGEIVVGDPSAAEIS